MTHEQHSFCNQMRGEGFGQGSEPEGHHQRMFEGGYEGFGGSGFFAGGQQANQAEFLDCNADMGSPGFGERGSRGRMHMGRREFEFAEMRHLRHKMWRLREELAEEQRFENMPAAYTNAAYNPEALATNGQVPATMPADYVPPQGQVASDQTPQMVPAPNDGTQNGAAQNLTDQSAVAPPTGDNGTPDGSSQQVDPVMAKIAQDAQQQNIDPNLVSAYMQQLESALASGQQPDLDSLLKQVATNMEQSGVSADDLATLQTIVQTDLTNAVNAQQASAQVPQGTDPSPTETAANPTDTTANPTDTTGSWTGAQNDGTGTTNGTGQNDGTVATNGTGQNDATDQSGPEISQTMYNIAQDASGTMTQQGFDAFAGQLQADLTTGGAQQLSDQDLINRVIGELKNKGVSQDDLTKLQTAANTDLAAAAQSAQANNPATDTNTNS